MIRTLSVENKLYKQPYQIGGILEYKENHYLIIGIQKIKSWRNALCISYIVQNMKISIHKETYISEPNGMDAFEISLKTNEQLQKRLDRIGVGEIFDHEGVTYQVMEYTYVTFEFTNVVITMLARQVVPASSEILRKARRDLKIKQSGLIVIKQEE